MCGRVRLTSDYSAIKIAFRIPDKVPAIKFPPRYNGAPTQDFPVVRLNPETGKRSLDLLHWGLVPSWSKDEKPSFNTINAHAETVSSSPAYRSAWKAGRRCILPVNGFYEWKALPNEKKQPYLVSRADGALMALGGLWEAKILHGGETLRTFTIITTRANTLMGRIHNRMPLVLGPDVVPTWLGETAAEPERVAKLKRQCPDKWLTTVPVDPRMSNVRNQGQEFCRPITV